MNLDKDFEEILAAFYEHKVSYMVVGGYAVNFHGYERNTNDLDIWVKPTTENLVYIIEALKGIGFEESSIAHIKKFDPTKPFLFHIGTKPEDIEVFNFVTGVEYGEAEPQKILFNYSSELPIYFISIQDLIVNKMLTNRTKDKLDVEMLQRIQKL
jgi:hypothetical protein